MGPRIMLYPPRNVRKLVADERMYPGQGKVNEVQSPSRRALRLTRANAETENVGKGLTSVNINHPDPEPVSSGSFVTLSRTHRGARLVMSAPNGILYDV